MIDQTSRLIEDVKTGETTLAEVCDDATNAVCQAMQEASMCLCPDGKCIAATVTFPAPIYHGRC